MVAASVASPFPGSNIHLRIRPTSSAPQDTAHPKPSIGAAAASRVAAQIDHFGVRLALCAWRVDHLWVPRSAGREQPSWQCAVCGLGAVVRGRRLRRRSRDRRAVGTRKARL